MDACNDSSSREVHFGEPFHGHLVPFSVRKFWKCLRPDVSESAVKFDEITREDLFMGYHLHSGGRWSGNYLVIDTATYAKSPDGERCR
eukprot:8989397-Pyramimonas_sp.AAC.1